MIHYNDIDQMIECNSDTTIGKRSNKINNIIVITVTVHYSHRQELQPLSMQLKHSQLVVLECVWIQSETQRWGKSNGKYSCIYDDTPLLDP